LILLEFDQVTVFDHVNVHLDLNENLAQAILQVNKYFICSQIVLIVNPYARWNEILKEFQILFQRINDYSVENKHDLTE